MNRIEINTREIGCEVIINGVNVSDCATSFIVKISGAFPPQYELKQGDEIIEFENTTKVKEPFNGDSIYTEELMEKIRDNFNKAKEKSII